MKRLLVLFALCAATSALPAQTRGEVTLFMPTTVMSDAILLDDGDDPLTLRHDRGHGYGAAAAIFLTRRISAEISLSRTKSRTSLQSSFDSIPAGNLPLTLASAVMRWHLAPASRFDPYLGAGAAWARFGNLESRELRGAGVSSLQVDGKLTYVIDGGLRLGLSRRLGLSLDGRYAPLRSSISEQGAAPLRVSFNPLSLGAGLSFRF